MNLFGPNATATVGPGVEFTRSLPGQALLSADLTGDELTIAYVAPPLGPNTVLVGLAWEFDSLDWLPTPGVITDVVDLGGSFGLDSLTFGPNSIEIRTLPFPVANGADLFRSFRIVAEHGGNNPIPEPGSATLFGIGSLLIGAALRRSRE